MISPYDIFKTDVLIYDGMRRNVPASDYTAYVIMTEEQLDTILAPEGLPYSIDKQTNTLRTLGQFSASVRSLNGLECAVALKGKHFDNGRYSVCSVEEAAMWHFYLQQFGLGRESWKTSQEIDSLFPEQDSI